MYKKFVWKYKHVNTDRFYECKRITFLRHLAAKEFNGSMIRAREELLLIQRKYKIDKFIFALPKKKLALSQKVGYNATQEQK